MVDKTREEEGRKDRRRKARLISRVAIEIRCLGRRRRTGWLGWWRYGFWFSGSKREKGEGDMNIGSAILGRKGKLGMGEGIWDVCGLFFLFCCFYFVLFVSPACFPFLLAFFCT
jgi:hypothetical protein